MCHLKCACSVYLSHHLGFCSIVILSLSLSFVVFMIVFFLQKLPPPVLIPILLRLFPINACDVLKTTCLLSHHCLFYLVCLLRGDSMSQSTWYKWNILFFSLCSLCSLSLSSDAMSQQIFMTRNQNYRNQIYIWNKMRNKNTENKISQNKSKPPQKTMKIQWERSVKP